MRVMLVAIIAALTVAPVSAQADALEGKRAPGEILESAAPEDWRKLDQENLLYIELARGTVMIALSPRLAQGHVEQMRALAREKFYDGLSFYRVIDGFVAQGGDVFEKREVKNANATLAAEFDEPLTEESAFSPLHTIDGYANEVGFIDSLPAGVDRADGKIWHLHCTGAVAMARDTDRDTGGAEIYITLQPQRYLDRNLTVFGRVVSGMEHVQALRRVAPPQSEEDDMGEKILSMRVGSDLPAEKRKQLQILRSDTGLFAEYLESRRNRPEAFFYYRPDHVDICQLPIPVRPVHESDPA